MRSKFIGRSLFKSLTQGQKGQGLVEYALLVMLAGMVLVGGLFLLGDATGNTLGQVVDSLTIEEAPTPTPLPGPKDVIVTVLDQDGEGIAGAVVLAYDGEGHFLAKTGTTGSGGSVVFNNLDPGSYRFRADHQLKTFWSETIIVPGQTSATIQISATPVTVNVVNSYGNAMAGIPVYAFNDKGGYLGMEISTDAAGTATFNLTDDGYKFRADYSGTDYWSSEISVPETTNVTITISLTPVEVRVTDRSGNAVSGQTVDAYIRTRGSNSELVSNSSTNAAGVARFELENGEFRFVTNYNNMDFASGSIEVPGTTTATIQIMTPITVQVLDNRSKPQNNIDVHAYKVTSEYIYVGFSTTGTDGLAYFTQHGGSLENGFYRFLASKAGGKKFAWSEIISVPSSVSTSIELPR